MKIGLITDNITDKPTGIGNYAKNFIDILYKTDKNNEHYIIDYKDNIYNTNNIKINNPFKLIKSYSWHNYLPLQMQKYNLDYIFNFSGCPHYLPYKEKEIFFVYDISWYLYPEYHPYKRVLYHKLLFKHTINNSAFIIVDSYSTKNDIVKYFEADKDKISIVYPYYKNNIKEDNTVAINQPYLLYVGTLEPRKNIINIIKAFHKSKIEANTDHKLIICGKKGWGFNEIYKEVQNRNLDGEILFKGYVTDEQKKYLYKHASAFIYPSYYEGFGIPIIEALTYGCPVITSNTSSLPEAIGNAGIQVNPNNIDDLSNAITKVISSPQLRQKMKVKGYSHLKEISSIEQIKTFLKRLA